MKLNLYMLVGILLISYTSSFSQGNCLDFDGIDDYVNINDHANIDFGTNSFTVEFWIKTSTKSTAIISKIDNALSTGWSFFLDGNGIINCQVNASSAAAPNGRNLADNTWHHIAIIRKNLGGSFEYLTFYVDGVNLGSPLLFSGGSVSNSDNLVFGDAPASSNYDGLLEEVRIWSTERSQAQIRSNMYVEISPYATGLVAYYRFSESSGVSTDNLQGLIDLDGTLINMTGSVWVSSTVPMPFETQSGASNWSATYSWKNGTIPNSSWAPVYIYHNIIVDDDYEAARVDVFGATVTIKPTGSLTLGGNLISSGTIKIQSNSSGDIGSLIDNGTLQGSMKLERYISQNKWHYFSIPIASASSDLFRGAALYYYNEPTATWNPISGGQTLSKAKGYDVFFPNTGDKTVTFNGAFTTGPVNIGLTYNSLFGQGYNLVGNPYPSAIDWDAASGWTRTNVNSAIYIWNPATLKAEVYVQGGGGATNGGSRYIPPTQGFFVICTANTSIVMTNDVRATTNRELREEYSNNELRLKITGRNNSDEALICFNQEATERFDGAYDAYKFFSLIPTDPQIYTENENLTQFSINSIPSSIESRSIPLHAYIGEDALYSIDVDFSHFDEQIEVYLEDLFNGNVINLRVDSKYEFTSKKGDNSNRFLIHFLPYGALYSEHTGLNDNVDAKYLIYSYEKNIYISSTGGQNVQEIMLIDLFGREVFRTKGSNSNLQKISPEMPSGVYILKLLTDEGAVTQKISLQ